VRETPITARVLGLNRMSRFTVLSFLNLLLLSF
jgi:hypothetical protein